MRGSLPSTAMPQASPQISAAASTSKGGPVADWNASAPFSRSERVPEAFGVGRHIVPIRPPAESLAYSLRHKLQNLGAALFPHASPGIVCPPGPLPTGPLPPIVVSSLMRSGTHLAIDLLLNNLAGYRQEPLYLDFDAYLYEGFSPLALQAVGSSLVKTHIAQRPFDEESAQALHQLAHRGLVIIPVRSPANIRKSMARWGYPLTEADILQQHQQQLRFWKDHEPILVEFNDLLDPRQAALFLAAVRRRLGLPPAPPAPAPIVAGSSRMRNLWRKLRTRIQASRAPILNTTLGFRL